MLVACGRAARLALLGVACVLVSLRLGSPAASACVREGARYQKWATALTFSKRAVCVDDVVLVKLLEEF
jgi:hypothetical protein